MGQPVTVVEKPSSRPGVVRFDINRSLTGMADERFTREDEVDGERPVDELARRLFEIDGVAAVHVSANVITVQLDRAEAGQDLVSVIEDLFIHYREGVAPDPASATTGA